MSQTYALPFIHERAANADLRSCQNFLVAYRAAGFQLAINPGSGGMFVLQNNPNTSGDVEVAGPPSRVPVFVDSGGTGFSQWLKLSTTRSGWASTAGSRGELGFIGFAVTSCGSGSTCVAQLC